MTDRLVEIQQKDLQNLKNLYVRDGLKNLIAYMTIDNYIRWFKQNPNLENVNFFSLNGDFSDGTFILTDGNFAYVDTCNESYNRLIRLLELLDYSKGYNFLDVRPEFRPIIKDVLEKAHVEISMDKMALLYCLLKEEALKLDVKPPDGIELRPITKLHDIEKVDFVWPGRSPTSPAFIQRMANYNTNVGAYTKDGTLVAWIFRFPTGLLGTLQTDEKYYGKGYGSLVTRYVSRKIAEMGHDVYTCVFENNIPSRSMFGKLGFKLIGEVYLIYTEIICSTADE